MTTPDSVFSVQTTVGQELTREPRLSIAVSYTLSLFLSLPVTPMAVIVLR